MIISNQLDRQTSNKANEDIFESFLTKTRLVNLYCSIFFTLIGLIGHCLTIFVFAQKRFRQNSSNVYLLCLAIIDALYLIVHFFKESITMYTDNYLNIIDKYDFACRLINYLRYVLRLISAYIIVSITIQRLSLVYSPFSSRLKTKKSAWLAVFVIVLISLLINLWVLFIVELKTDHNKKYCDIKPGFDILYYYITIVYISIKMLIPIVLILISNSIIIINIMRLGSNKYKLRENHSFKKKKFYSRIKPGLKIKPFYLTLNQVINRVTIKANNSKILTKLIILISFSYVLLNFPYFIIWTVYYYNESVFNSRTTNLNSHWFVALKLAEIFYLLNYAINFYIYCASGSVFRKQLKYSSKLENLIKYFFKF